MSDKQGPVNDAIGVLADVSDQLHVVQEAVGYFDKNDKELIDTAKQAVDAVTLLRLRLFNRSTQGKYRK